MKLSLILAILSSCLVSAAMAQELPDMTGVWTYTASGMEAHPRCGEAISTGEVDIHRKITARAYRANVRTEQSYEKCPGSLFKETTATVRVKDNLITIDYDEDGWEKDRLRLVDGEMTGEDGKGVSTHWVRAVVTGADDDSLSEEQLAELETFLALLGPRILESLDEEYAKALQKGLGRTGLEEEDAAGVAELTLERMSDCMVDMIRKEAITQQVPLGEILKYDSTIRGFNPKDVEFRGLDCVDDAFMNAGVRIR